MKNRKNFKVIRLHLLVQVSSTKDSRYIRIRRVNLELRVFVHSFLGASVGAVTGVATGSITGSTVGEARSLGVGA